MATTKRPTRRSINGDEREAQAKDVIAELRGEKAEKAPRGGGSLIEIMAIEQQTLKCACVGTTPIILHRVSVKAQRELLMPKGRKTAADKAQSLKHDVLEEFRNSPYTLPDPDAPTLLAVLATAFKGSMRTAALDVPGAKKAQIGRLIRVEGERLPLFGVPQLLMSVTRSSDIQRTPDIRTRCIVPKWACFLEITYPKTMLREKAVLNLLAAGGIFSGVGDWRTEKGAGNYGSWRLANLDDEELNDIVEQGGRDAQTEAMAKPTAYDDETESLLTWFASEADQRGMKVTT